MKRHVSYHSGFRSTILKFGPLFIRHHRPDLSLYIRKFGLRAGAHIEYGVGKLGVHLYQIQRDRMLEWMDRLLAKEPEISLWEFLLTPAPGEVARRREQREINRQLREDLSRISLQWASEGV